MSHGTDGTVDTPAACARQGAPDGLSKPARYSCCNNPSPTPSSALSVRKGSAHCARACRSDNPYFSCFVYDLLYDGCSHRQRPRTRALLGWNTKAILPSALTLPRFLLPL